MSTASHDLTKCAMEILHRSRTLRSQIAGQQQEDAYVSNTSNSCLQLELLIERTYLSETRLGQIKDAKYQFAFLVRNLKNLVFLKENCYERIIFKGLWNLVIATLTAGGHHEAAQLLDGIGKRRIAISEIMEAVDTDEMFREALKRAEDSKIIYTHEEDEWAERRLHMLTGMLEACVGVDGEDKEEEDLIDLETVLDQEWTKLEEEDDSDCGFELVDHYEL